MKLQCKWAYSDHLVTETVPATILHNLLSLEVNTSIDR